MDMGRKLGRGSVHFLGRVELGPHLTQSRLSRVLPPYQVASSAIQPFGHNRYGPKIGGLPPLGGGEAGSLSNTAGWRLCVVASVVRRMNEVTVHWARLLLEWVTVFGRVYHHGV